MATNRINVSLSDDMLKYFDDLSSEIGLSRNAAIVMALKTYMDQQKSLDFSKFYKVLEQLTIKENENKENEN